MACERPKKKPNKPVKSSSDAITTASNQLKIDSVFVPYQQDLKF